tara:strand:- start:78 stop:1772 length:1695 start_codon:yes stop_codon:yes gene_type:complete
MNQQETKACIQDFKVFLKHTWLHLRLPQPTRMQYYIADYLQEGHKRSQLEALRGIGKTWITGAYVAWRLLRNPNEKILIISQSGAHSDNIAIFIRKLIDTMAILEHLIPRSDQRSSVISFDVNGCEVSVQPSVKALGITSQLQGNRASLLISDDVEGQNNSATEKRRQDLLNQVAEYEAILQTTDNAQILVLGTPQTSESIYTRLRDKGYVTRIYPAKYPDNTDSYQGCLADYIVQDINNNPALVNKSIDERFSDEDLYQRELSYGRSGFKLQFMLDTTLSDAEKYPLKTKDLIVTDLSPEQAPTKLMWSSQSHDSIQDIPNVGFTGDTLQRPSLQESYGNYEGSILAIDPSGRGADEMGWCVVNHLLGKVFIPAFGGLHGGYDEANLVKLSEIAKEYKVNKVVVESNFGDGMFTSLLTPVLNAIYPVATEEIRNNVQKEKRIIDTLEPLMNQHRLVFDYSAIKKDLEFALSEPKNIYYSLIYQLSHITYERGALVHDDRLDVLAMGVQFWNDYGILKQDSDDALGVYKKKLIEDELKRRGDIFKGMQKRPQGKASLSRVRAFN